MSSDNKPITPLTSQRATTSGEDDKKSTEKPKPSAEKVIKPRKTAKTSPKGSSFTLKFFVFISLVIAIFALYFTWKNTTNKWQVEAVNELQTTSTALKVELANLENTLANKITQLADQYSKQPNDNTQTNAFSKQFNQQLTEIKAEVKTLATNINDDESQQNSEKTTYQLTAKISKQNMALTALSEQLEALTSQYKKQQQSNQLQLKLLKKKLASKENTTAKAILSISKLSNQQIHNWVLQINNQWLFEGDKISTTNNLRALKQAIENSNTRYKQTLLAKIAQDQKTVEGYQPPTIALEKIKSLKKWLHNLEVTSNSQSVSRETNATDNNWQQMKNKINELFSIRKKQSAEDLSVVETELEKRIIKQRMLLQAEQLGWAIHSQSPQVIHYAMDDISQLISQYVPDQLNTWQVKMIALMPSSQLSKSPLAITEINYVEHH